MKLLFFGVLLFWATTTHAQEAEHGHGTERGCGTFQYLENMRNPRFAKSSAQCDLSASEVYVDSTAHFVLYYTLEGPHRIASANTAHPTAYIDSLKKYLEAAYALHSGKLNMGTIKGITFTDQYQKRVPAGKYPVEVLDIGLLRGQEGEYTKTLGITVSSIQDAHSTQIFIENDFRFGATCESPGICTENLSASCATIKGPKGDDYRIKWWLPLEVTVIHELYHAFQFVLVDMTAYNPTLTFWAEASATGAEEVGAPDVDDYWSYLESASLLTGSSLSAYSDGNGYGAAPFYLFLLHHLGDGFDRQIWNFFKKYPQDDFWTQYSNLMAARKLSGEELFFQFAHSMLFTGTNAALMPPEDSSALIFAADQANWASWRVHTEQGSPAVRKRGLAKGAFDLVQMETEPILDSVGLYERFFVKGVPIFVMSRIGAGTSAGTGDRPFYAYPNPWNPLTQTVKFKNPPVNDGIELRTADGLVFERIPKTKVNREWSPQYLPAPGILYYRALPHGKAQKLLVEY
jgi:hypothetical protein